MCIALLYEHSYAYYKLTINTRSSNFKKIANMPVSLALSGSNKGERAEHSGMYLADISAKLCMLAREFQLPIFRGFGDFFVSVKSGGVEAGGAPLSRLTGGRMA
jgi:hypothetical protein